MILEDMYRRYNGLVFLKDGLAKRGYCFKDISYINGQIDLMTTLINKESHNILNGLLRQKTYCRLFNKIEKGVENLIDVINNPVEWKLCMISEHNEEWANKKALIFSTKKGIFVFTKNNYRDGQKYIDNKWQ